MKGLRTRRAAGFTLVELLVVIAIITVLIAISLPVFSRARERSRQAACMANLHQIAMAVRMYRMDMGQYPGYYDPVTGEGGINTLYPAYLDSRRALICPDDVMDSGQKYVDSRVLIYDTPGTYKETTYRALLEAASSLYMDDDPDGEYFIKLWKGEDFTNPRAPLDPSFFQEHYSSYNYFYNWVGYVGETSKYSFCDLGTQVLLRGDNLAFWYAWHRWDPGNELGVWGSPQAYELVNSQLQYHLAQQTYWPDYEFYLNGDTEADRGLMDGLRRPLWDPGNPDSNSYEYMPYGMPSPVLPGLINRNAPDTTIITRCSAHRPFNQVFYGKDEETGKAIISGKDIALRLDGSAVMLVGLEYSWATQPRAASR